MGTTHRYKNKYVTTVMYKPKRRRNEAQQQGMGGMGGGMGGGFGHLG